MIIPWEQVHNGDSLSNMFGVHVNVGTCTCHNHVHKCDQFVHSCDVLALHPMSMYICVIDVTTWHTCMNQMLKVGYIHVPFVSDS